MVVERLDSVQQVECNSLSVGSDSDLPVIYLTEDTGKSLSLGPPITMVYRVG